MEKIFGDRKVIIIIQFQSGFFLVRKGGRIHLILSAIALTPSLHLVRSAASSVFNPTSFTLSSTCFLHVNLKKLSHKEAFIILKDHKPNFASSRDCWLINPVRTNIGIISKAHFDAINSSIRSKTGLQQWRNTKAVIAWFDYLSEKDNCKFP